MRSLWRAISPILSIVIAFSLCVDRGVTLLRSEYLGPWGWLYLLNWVLIAIIISAELWRGRNA